MFGGNNPGRLFFGGGGREEGKVEGGGGLGNRVTFIYSIYIRLKRFTEIQGVLPLKGLVVCGVLPINKSISRC